MRGSAVPARPPRRRRFGLDTVLPADAGTIEADVLRLLAEAGPDLIVVRPSDRPDRVPAPGHRAPPPLPAGAPDLLLLGPEGRAVCLKIKTQAGRLSRDQAGFADLCRGRRVPFAVVRSLAEARAALVRFGLIATGG